MNLSDREWVQSLPGNDQCFVCGCHHTSSSTEHQDPTKELLPKPLHVPVDWASVTFGIVLCLHCSGIHRGLGVHSSFVKSLTLDTFTNEQTHRMKAGGNQALLDFFHHNHVPTNGVGEDPTAPAVVRALFTSPAAIRYQQRLDEKAKARDFATPKTKRRKQPEPIVQVPPPLEPLPLLLEDHQTLPLANEEPNDTAGRTDGTGNPQTTTAAAAAIMTPTSTARELMHRFQEYTHVLRRRTTPSSPHKRPSISILHPQHYHDEDGGIAAPALTWRDVYSTVFAMLVEDILLATIMPPSRHYRHASWQTVASQVFFVTSAMLGLVVLLVRDYYVVVFLWTAALLIGLPCVGWTLVTAWVSRRMIQHRQTAFPSAKLLLYQRRLAQRADHQETFDLYLPPPAQQQPPVDQFVVPNNNPNGMDNSGNPNENSDPPPPPPRTFATHNNSHKNHKPQQVPGLIFVPGALVEHSAYAPLAAQLSDLGMVVAVVSLEPLRVGTYRHGGVGPTDLLPIFYHVASHHGDAVEVVDWAIGGHDLGGMAAATVMGDLNLHKCILLGVTRGSSLCLRRQYHHESKNNNSNNNTQKKDAHFLCIQASNDTLAIDNNNDNDSNIQHSAIANLLRVREDAVQYETVLGGNHAGFGHYGPQTFPIADGKRTIPLAEQQLQTAESIASFLLDEPCIIERMGSVSTHMDSFDQDDHNHDDYVPFDYDSNKHKQQQQEEEEDQPEVMSSDSEKENSKNPETATTTSVSVRGKRKIE